MKKTTSQTRGSDLPQGLASPAQRALEGAGIQNLEQLSRMREADVASLHGIGPNALKKLKEAMAEKGLAFQR